MRQEQSSVVVVRWRRWQARSPFTSVYEILLSTGLSRGTQRNSLYIVDPPDERADERHAPEPVSDAVTRARRSLTRTLAKSMAMDQLDPGAPTAPTAHEVRCPRPLAPDLGPDLAL